MACRQDGQLQTPTVEQRVTADEECWRRAAPIQAAIRQGLTETGVSIMRMVPALDAGPVILQASTNILNDETYGKEVTDDLRRLIRTLNEVADKLNEGEGTASRLINDPASYRHCHHLPESYPVIEGHTPHSVWLPLASETDMDERAGAVLSGFCSDTIRLAVVP